MASIEVTFCVQASQDGWRLDRFLQEKIRRLSRERIQKIIASGTARLVIPADSVPPLARHSVALKPATRVRSGWMLFLTRELEPEPDVPERFDVVYDQQGVLCVDKPAGLPVHPTARYFHHTFTALARLRFIGRKIDPAHRLDRETSGLLLCGDKPEVTTLLKRDFARGRVSKRYLAICHGWPTADQFDIDEPLAMNGTSAVRVRMHVDAAGAPSLTEVTVLGRRRCSDGAPIALLSCRPRTGRQHQIRVHLAHVGFPLVGDKIYGKDEGIFIRFTERALTDDDHLQLRLARHALHAAELGFRHPTTGEQVILGLNLPSDMQSLWAQAIQT